jgi:hypothetical protein
MCASLTPCGFVGIFTTIFTKLLTLSDVRARGGVVGDLVRLRRLNVIILPCLHLSLVRLHDCHARQQYCEVIGALRRCSVRTVMLDLYTSKSAVVEWRALDDSIALPYMNITTDRSAKH